MNFFARLFARFRKPIAQAPTSPVAAPAPAAPVVDTTTALVPPAAAPAAPTAAPTTAPATPSAWAPPAGYVWTSDFGGQWRDPNGQLIGNTDPWAHKAAVDASRANLTEVERINSAETYAGRYTYAELTLDDKAYLYQVIMRQGGGYKNIQSVLGVALKGTAEDRNRVMQDGEGEHSYDASAYNGKLKGLI